MKEKKQSEELQSRREFFKEAAKKALPVIGAIALAGTPFVAQAAEVGSSSCKDCTNGCRTGCSRSCKSTCAINCQGSSQKSGGRECETCKSLCQGCSGQCNSSCMNACQSSSYAL